MCGGDCQVRVSTNFGGLSYFQPPRRVKKFSAKVLLKVPHVNLAADQGGDQLSGGHCVFYLKKGKLCATLWWDPQHGCNRDFWLAVGKVGKRSTMLLDMVIMNIHSGPDDSDMRFNQISEVVLKHVKTSSYGACAFYSYHSKELVQELDVAMEDGDDNLDAATWRANVSRIESLKKGYKTNQGRFLAVVADGEALIDKWSCTTYDVSVCALDMDMIETKALPHIKVKWSGADVQSNKDSLKGPTAAERALRNCGANAVVLSLALLSDPNQKRTLAIIVCGALPLKTWLGIASRSLRSVDGARQWVLQQQAGDAVASISSVWSQLLSHEYLQKTQFAPSSHGSILHMSQEEINHDNDFACMAGTFQSELVKNRSRRLAYMLDGLPHSLAITSQQGATKSQAAKAKLVEFKRHFEVYKRAKANAAATKNPALVQAVARSPFETFSVQQWVARCELSGWKCDQALHSFSVERFSTCVASQVVEDVNNKQKNMRTTTGWGGRYRRPQVALAATVRSHVLSKEYKYEEPVYDKCQPLVPTLERADIQPTKKSGFDVTGVASSKAAAPYFSPTAENVGLPTADLKSMDALDSINMLETLVDTTAGFFVDASHQLIFRNPKCTRGISSEVMAFWHLPLQGQCLLGLASVN